MPTSGSRAGAGDWDWGGRSCKTRRKTLMKPQYSYMQNVIEIQVEKQSFSIAHEAKYEMRTGSREVLPNFHVHKEFYTARINQLL